MRAIRFEMGENYYDGFTDGTFWNGFTNVWIIPTERDRMVALLTAEAKECEGELDDYLCGIDEIPAHDGLVSLAYGFTTCEVEAECEYCKESDGHLSDCSMPGFEYQGIWITDPTKSECTRFTVDPEEYYGQAYIDYRDLCEETN